MHENFGICQEFLVEDFGIFKCITWKGLSLSAWGSMGLS